MFLKKRGKGNAIKIDFADNKSLLVQSDVEDLYNLADLVFIILDEIYKPIENKVEIFNDEGYS